MIEAQRRAYLEAMGISVWLTRSGEPDQQGLLLGAGSGSTLLLCRTPEESSTVLAADIVRCLDDPVWAWPDPVENTASPSLHETIDNRLFTLVVLFGEKLAGSVFNAKILDVLGSARIAVVPDLDVMAVDGNARRSLWLSLADQGAGIPN